MNTSVDSTPAFIEATYKKMDANIATVKERLGRALTYGEKILYGHLDNAADAELIAGSSYIKTRPDRIALQDATAQMALLQFMQAGKVKVAVPSTVHCDHLIQAKLGAEQDLEIALRQIKDYQYMLAAQRLTTETDERKYAFDIKPDLKKMYEETIQKNQEILKIIRELSSLNIVE